MKAIIKSIVLLFFLNLISIHFLSSQECGYTNEGPIVNYQVANRSYSTIDLRVQVYAIMNSDGSKGVTRDQAVASMTAVAADFLDNYDIKLNYCVREIRSDYAYNFKPNYTPECYSNSIQFSIHENCTTSACGTAGGENGSASGWALNKHSIIMHEFGHIFGLHHTHNNSHKRDASCLLNPKGCAETVHQKNCNLDGPLTCKIDGDGICDTPADPLCYTTTWCSNFVKDRCEVNYPTPTQQVLLKNFMSYYIYPNGGIQIEFTPDQKNQMHGYINANYQNLMGEMSSCDNSEITAQQLGKFTTSQTFTNQTLYFENGLTASNCNLLFTNCTVHLAGNITLDNALLYFDHNTTFKSGAFDFCTGVQTDKWGGVRSNKSTIMGFKGAFLESIDPVISNDQNSTSLVWLDNVNVNGTENAISLKGDVGLILNNGSIINGSISKYNTSIITGPYSYFGGANIYYSKVLKSAPDLFSPGIDLLNTNAIFEHSELSNFGLGLVNPGNSTIIHHSNFKSIGDAALSCSNNSLFKMTDSHVDGSYISIANPTAHDIHHNNFKGSIYEGIFLSNKDAVTHSIHNNKFENNQKGILTQGKQTGLKMLCNSFTSLNRDFQWQNDVDPLQGKDQITSAGNIFSMGNVLHITGGSETEIRYNYYSLGTNERPINNNHSNLFVPPGLSTSAGCGTIGASWTPPGSPPPCPPGINCTQPCPQGIDCTQPCPPGINCTQDCPPGINCTQACPPGINCLPTNPTGCPQGIDCTQACPPGINCAQDCPPGIDCTQPCPAGIDCTQPCPLGIDCYVACPQGIDCHTHCPPGIECDQPCTLPQGCHEPCISCLQPGDPVLLPKPCDDPLFTYLDNQYNQYEAQYVALRDAYMSLPQYGELSQLLNQQSLVNKPRIIQLFNEESRLVTPHTIKLVLDNSVLYTEAEVVSLMKLNPALMLDSKIKPIISKSSTFTNASINEIQSNYNQNTQSQVINNLWALDAKKTKMSSILHYGLYRLAYYDLKYCERYNQWLRKFNTLSAEMHIIDNLLSQNRTSEINALYGHLLSDPQYSQSDKFDISQCQILTNLLISVANNGRNLSQLSLTEQQQLNAIALSSARFSAIKAQGILNAMYNYNYPQFVDQEEIPQRLYFLDSGNTINRSKITYDINIAPNPTTGTITVTYNVDEAMTLRVVSLDGRQHLNINLPNKVNTISLDDLIPGVYFYSITNESNSIIKSDRIVLIK